MGRHRVIARIYSRSHLVSFWEIFGDWSNMSVYSLGVRLFSFDRDLRYELLFSDRTVSDDEKLWIAANVGMQIGQLLLLLFMWRAFRSRQQKENAIALRDLFELVPPWGLLRGIHALQLITTSSWIAFGFSAASILFASLVRLLNIKPVRLITLALPLLYVDTMACILSVAKILYFDYELKIPNVLKGHHHKPRIALPFLVLFHGCPLMIVSWYTWFLTPLCTAALMLQYLLVRHIPESLVEPIPLPSSSSINFTDHFCEVCERIILARLDECSVDFNGYKLSVHHWTTKSLQSSAIQGCRICTTVWHHLSLLSPGLGFRWLLLPFMTQAELNHRTIIIHAKYRAYLCYLGIGKADERFVSHSFPRKTLPTHTGSENGLELAKKWYLDCTSSHSDCFCADSSFGFRPSRLLYLAGDDQIIYLHTHEDYASDITYMTLSHCWGKAHIIQLRQDTEEALRNGVSLDRLPKTFNDAIRIAKHLGSEYLWIDSLCIMQDSLDDWNTEARMMGDVYRNSTCNIAASNAPNSSEGCLFPRDPRLLQPAYLPSSSSSSTDRFYVYDDNDEEPFVLYTRAWVLQEALLAPRTLDCGRHQLFWKCDTLMATEEYPDRSPPHRFAHPRRNLESLRSMAEQMKSWSEIAYPDHDRPIRDPSFFRLYSSEFRSSPAAYWGAIVESYSSMALTIESDRAIAIAGAVPPFRTFLGQYWAGMWQKLLPVQLLWKTDNGRAIMWVQPQCIRPPNKRAPSWSWMSVVGAVFFKETCEFYDDSVLVSQFIKADVQSPSDIRLHLRAPLVRATWESFFESVLGCITLPSPSYYVRSGTGEIRWRIVHPEHQLLRNEKNKIADPSVLDAYFDVEIEMDEARDIYLMAIVSQHKNIVSGIVLQSEKDDTFSRLGVFKATEGATRLFQIEEERDVVLV